MKVKCEYSELVPLNELIPNPRNNNRHSIEQIERLAKIIDYQGMRAPIVVSKRSGFVVKGHCRLEALRLLEWQKAPIDYQEYESEAQEYADMTADNEIARWAELDYHKMMVDLEEIEYNIDTVYLGTKSFNEEIDDIAPIEDVNESVSFKIKCANLREMAVIQNKFGITGDSVSFDKFTEVFTCE